MTCRVIILFVVACASCSAAEPTANVERELQAKLADAEMRVEANSDDVRALLDRGDALFFLGRFEEAIRDYDRMIALQPELGPTHWQRGLALHFAGQYDDAAKQFERFFELDKSDRENGIWRFYAQVKKDGVDSARKALFVYEQPDREPLPIIYHLCEGKATPADVAKSVEAAGIPPQEKRKRQFYAELYLGLDAAIVRNDAKAARPHFERAVANRWPRSAGYGPTYMWHVARLSLDSLGAPPPQSEQKGR